MKEFKVNNNYKITSGFTTPEGYFDTITEQIISKINLPKSKVKTISIYTKRAIISVAAVLIVALSATIYYKMEVSNSEDSSIQNYIATQLEISQYDIIALLDKKDIENLSIELKINEIQIDEDFTNTIEIENFIID